MSCVGYHYVLGLILKTRSGDEVMTEAGYRVLLSDTAVTTVHVLFDEPISERSENYSKELEEATRMNVV